MTGERRVLRSRLWNMVAAGLLLMLAAGCVAFAVGGARPIGVEAVAGAAAVVLLAGAVRVLTVGVRATPDALIVRELFRTKRLPWSAVRRALLVMHRPKTFGSPSVSTPMPELQYVGADGRWNSILVTSLGARRVAVAERNVEALNELIRTRGHS